MLKSTRCTALAISLIAVSAVESRADLDAVVGGIVGGIIAGAVKNNQQQARRTTTKRSTPRRSYARTDADIQRALNHFGCDAGTPDGILGPRTTRAIKCFQSQLGEAQTGTLTAAQTSKLYTQYARDTSSAFDRDAGGSRNNNAPAPSNGNYDQLMASLGSQTTNNRVIAGTVGTVAMVGVGTEALGGLTPAAPPAQADQPFCASVPEQQSGGLASASDVDSIVDSYCAAMGYADQETRNLLAAAQSFDAEQAEAGCEQFLAAHRVRIEAAFASPASDAVTSLRQIIPGSQGNPDTIDSLTVCHGIAAVANNVEDQRAFSAMVAAYGGDGYGELVAASYALGLGTAQNTQSASDWYLWTAEALEGGGAPLIDAGDYNHIPLLAALSESALSVTTDWRGYLAQSAAQPVSGGFALPGLSAAPQPARLPADFESRFGMTGEQALQACRDRTNDVFMLGKEGCRIVADAYQDTALLVQYQ